MPKVSCETRSRRSTRVSRQATVEVRAGTMTIQAPKGNKVAVRSVCVHAVMVREVDPPRGEVPVEWILLTTLPISTPHQTMVWYGIDGNAECSRRTQSRQWNLRLFSIR